MSSLNRETKSEQADAVNILDDILEDFYIALNLIEYKKDGY
jgi:hypothetical protein